MDTPERPVFNNDWLGDELRDVLARLDPVPEQVEAQARDAIHSAAMPDSQRLELVYDSVLDADLMPVQGDRYIRSLSFAGGGLRLVVRLQSYGGGETALSGWGVPVRLLRAVIHTHSGTADATVEPDGAFSAVLRPGNTRIALEVDTDGKPRRFHSSWFSS